MLRHRWQNNMPDCRSRHDRASALWVSRCDRMSDGSAVAGWNQLAPPHPPDAALPLAHGRKLGSRFGSSAKGFLAILIAPGILTRRVRGPDSNPSLRFALVGMLASPPPRCGQRNRMWRGLLHAPRAKLWPLLTLLQVADASHPTGAIGPLTRPSTFAGRWCNLAIRCGWRRKVLSPSRNCATAAPGRLLPRSAGRERRCGRTSLRRSWPHPSAPQEEGRLRISLRPLTNRAAACPIGGQEGRGP